MIHGRNQMENERWCDAGIHYSDRTENFATDYRILYRLAARLKVI